MIKKTTPFVCPFCGSHNTQILDTSITPIPNTPSGISVDVDIECNDCEEQFTDFFDAEYIGYVSHEGVYDEKNDVVPQ